MPGEVPASQLPIFTNGRLGEKRGKRGTLTPEAPGALAEQSFPPVPLPGEVPGAQSLTSENCLYKILTNHPHRPLEAKIIPGGRRTPLSRGSCGGLWRQGRAAWPAPSPGARQVAEALRPPVPGWGGDGPATPYLCALRSTHQSSGRLIGVLGKYLYAPNR